MFQPKSDWKPQKHLPNLSCVKEVSIDVETRDPGLKTMGPGWCFDNAGYITGLSLATHENSWYFPIAHEGTGNLDRGHVLSYIKDLCSRHDTRIIWFNRLYDQGWLKKEGISCFNGDNVDSLTAIPLLDENRKSYSLDSICNDLLGLQKNEDLLNIAAKAWGIDPKHEMWKLPSAYVGPYAEYDAKLHFALWQYCEPRLKDEDLWPVFELETNLIPLLIEMRIRGVPVDLDYAEQVAKKLEKREKQYLKEIQRRWGVRVDMWAARSVAQAFDKAGLFYPRTPKTHAASFRQEWLESQTHDLPRMLVGARKLNKARNTFIEKLIYQHQVNGRIHAQFHPLRADAEEDDTGARKRGAVSGRFSSSNPSLQVIPARDPELGPLIRGIFVPEHGENWYSFDYNQQEPRLVVHFAHLTRISGAKKARERYFEGKADFHQMVAEMADIPRDKAKIINLGLFYGMGKNKLAAQLGMSLEEAEPLFDQYHKNVPFIRGLSNACANAAERRGYVRTILGRRRHFNLWEPIGANIYVAPEEHQKALRLQASPEDLVWCGKAIRRAYTHKAMNSVIQGSAADQTKKSMLDCWREGIVPFIQLHDELCMSLSNPEMAQKVKQIMLSAISLEVPSAVDHYSGKRWGKF